MDGTLVANSPVHIRAFEIFCARYGVTDWKEKLANGFGMGNDDIMRLVMPGEVIREKGLAALADEKEAIYREIYAPDIRPVEGLKELLERLRAAGIPCAVGSSGCKANVDFVLDSCAIRPYFDAAISGDMVSRCKPDPEIYLTAAAALGVSPFIMQSTESLVTITLNRGMAQYGGELYMGTITILQSVMQLIVLPLQGLTQGTQPIISYNYGAKNLDRVRATFKRVFLISMIYTISAFALVCLLAWPLSRMFTSDAALIDLTVKAMPVFFGGIWAFGAQMSCQAAFMGLGQAKVSLFLALLRKVILLIPLAIVLPMVLGGDPFAIYLAEPASDFIASATTLTIFLLFYKRTLNRPAD